MADSLQVRKLNERITGLKTENDRLYEELCKLSDDRLRTTFYYCTLILKAKNLNELKEDIQNRLKNMKRILAQFDKEENK